MARVFEAKDLLPIDIPVSLKAADVAGFLAALKQKHLYDGAPEECAARLLLDQFDEIDALSRLGEYFSGWGVFLKAQGRGAGGERPAPDLRVTDIRLEAEVKLATPTVAGYVDGQHRWPGVRGKGMAKDFEWLLKPVDPKSAVRACVVFCPTKWVWGLDRCLGLENGSTSDDLEHSPFSPFAQAATWTQEQRPLKHKGGTLKQSGEIDIRLRDYAAGKVRFDLVGPVGDDPHLDWILWAAVYTLP